MSYTFITKLLGPASEVEGVFYAGEKETINCPGEAPTFEIELISINDELFEVDMLSDEAQQQIIDEAFKKASDERGEY